MTPPDTNLYLVGFMGTGKSTVGRQVARQLGFRFLDSDHEIERTRVMGAYRASTLVDFERGQPLELESLFLEPLRQARAAGVRAPRLEALCRVLTALNPA